MQEFSTQAHFEDTPIEAHHRTMAVNVNGVLNGCHAALPYLKQASFARVINLSSASAIYGRADLISYSASKFAVRGTTEGLDIESAKNPAFGIRCHAAICTYCNGERYGCSHHSKHGCAFIDRRCRPGGVSASDELKIRFSTNTHRAVGLKAKTLMQLSSISPQWLNRLSNRLLAKRH